MYEPAIEAAPWEEQAVADDERYRRQVAYLFARSRFYREKLTRAGFAEAGEVGGLADIARLPLTEKDELRASRSADEPIGTHLAASMSDVVRIYSTSGTTGLPSFVPLTRRDLAGWVRISSRSYSASGLKRGDLLLSTYNAGPFVAGAALDAFNELGVTHIPVGTGNSDRLMSAVRLLKPTVMAMTPSYALHLAEWARDHGIDAPATGIERIMVAGEPGGGEPAMRANLEQAWNAKVTEAMGIGDIAVSLWGECPEQQGMHFGGRGLVHFELIEPESGKPLPLADGVRGELVYSHLEREAAPLLRFRSRDHVEMQTGRCGCGRTSPRIRCIGRTDDMLIVRGVNVFPTALRETVNLFQPEVSGVISVRPRHKGVRQDPPLKVIVELTGSEPPQDAMLAERIRGRIREALLVNTEIVLVGRGSLPRSEYKSKLVDWSET
jgi:phenylacetate-CoA ligase